MKKRGGKRDRERMGCGKDLKRKAERKIGGRGEEERRKMYEKGQGKKKK